MQQFVSLLSKKDKVFWDVLNISLTNILTSMEVPI